MKTKMGRACSTYVWIGDVHTEFWWRNLREGDPGVDGRIILESIFEKWDGQGIDWICLAQDMDRWRSLVNAVINLRVP